jgi:hypothetical protein
VAPVPIDNNDCGVKRPAQPGLLVFRIERQRSDRIFFQFKDLLLFHPFGMQRALSSMVNGIPAGDLGGTECKTDSGLYAA